MGIILDMYIAVGNLAILLYYLNVIIVIPYVWNHLGRLKASRDILEMTHHIAWTVLDNSELQGLQKSHLRIAFCS